MKKLRWFHDCVLPVGMSIALISFIVLLISSWINMVPKDSSLSSTRVYKVDKFEVHYFRDEASQLCFAYFAGHPDSLVTVNCDTIRWP